MKAKRDHHGKVYLRAFATPGEIKVFKMIDGEKVLVRTETPQPFENIMKFGKQVRR